MEEARLRGTASLQMKLQINRYMSIIRAIFQGCAPLIRSSQSLIVAQGLTRNLTPVSALYYGQT